MLRNELVRLRALEETDLDWFYELENDVSIWRTNDTLTPLSRGVLQKYIEFSANLDIFELKQLFLLVESHQAEQVGVVQMWDYDPLHRRAEVGVAIDKKMRGKGYAYAALSLLLDYAFDFLNLHQCYANIPEDNHHSLALFKKLGFEQTGFKKDWLLWDGGKGVVFMQKIKQL